MVLTVFSGCNSVTGLHFHSGTTLISYSTPSHCMTVESLFSALFNILQYFSTIFITFTTFMPCCFCIAMTFTQPLDPHMALDSHTSQHHAPSHCMTVESFFS